MADHIRYDLLTQQATSGRRAQCPHGHRGEGASGRPPFLHFVRYAAPTASRLSDRLRAQYPDEMTIILQHQFWDLKVGDDEFEVGLSFGGIPEKLAVPFEAINGFFDPSVNSACNLKK